MPDLTDDQRERLARAAGYMINADGYWMKGAPAFMWQVDGPPEVSTDELFWLLDRLYPDGHRLEFNPTTAEVIWYTFDVAEQPGYRCVAAEYTRRLALERAVLAGLEKEAEDGA